MQNILGQWLASLKQYLLMCLLLSSPERLPYHPYCIALTIFAYFVIGLLLVNEQTSYGIVSTQIILELVLLALIAYVGLRWKNSLTRLSQTYSALVGINLAISAVTIPIYRMVARNETEADTLLLYLTLAILIWNLAVMSLIFKRALDISTHLSAMISFNYFVFYQFIVYWLYE